MNLESLSPYVSVSRNSKTKELEKMQGGTLETEILSNSSPLPDKKNRKNKAGDIKGGACLSKGCCCSERV